jgi:hypothetical protein
MVIGSLFCLSRGLSVLVEVVRMLNLGKKGKRAKGVARLLCPLGSLRRSGGSMPTSAGSGAVEPLGFDSAASLDWRVK